MEPELGPQTGREINTCKKHSALSQPLYTQNSDLLSDVRLPPATEPISFELTSSLPKHSLRHFLYAQTFSLSYNLIALSASFRISNRRAIEKLYDKVAKDWHLSTFHGVEWPAQALKTFLNAAKLQQRHFDILELGCANGGTSTQVISELFRSASPHVSAKLTGVDFSRKMIDEARKREYKGVDAKFEVAEMIEYLKNTKPQSFDLITSFGVLPYHMKNSEVAEFISLAALSLRPNGIIIFESPPDDPFFTKWFNAVRSSALAADLNLFATPLAIKKTNLGQEHCGIALTKLEISSDKARAGKKSFRDFKII